MSCRRYRLLEIELDAVYRSMLLLKKKKYAAVKVRKQTANFVNYTTQCSLTNVVSAIACTWLGAYPTGTQKGVVAG